MKAPCKLEIIKRNIVFDLQEKLPAILSNEANDIDGETFLDVCMNYRKLAICALLSDANTDFCFHQLYKSGHVYFYFLSSCQNNRARDPYYLCTSRAEPFFDSIAANDLETARKIASLSSDTWAEDDEYEDDFCYFLFLMKLLTGGKGSNDQLDSILERFETALQGIESHKLNICRALYEKEAGNFNASLEALIEERDEEIKRERDGGLPSDPEMLETEAHIYMEGIALVRLARQRDIVVGGEYKFIPSMALVPMTSPFPSPQSWKSIQGF